MGYADFSKAIERGAYQWGDKYSAPVTNDLQRRFFGSQRVEVTSYDKLGQPVYVRRGTIGISSGWSPVLLLMHTRRALGSWDHLGADDEITAIIDKHGRRHPVA